MLINNKKESISDSKPYPALSNAEILKDGSSFHAHIKYGPHPFLDGLYSNVCNYDTNWSWTIKETYHELVMKGQIVCTIE